MTDYIKTSLWEKMVEWDVQPSQNQDEILQIVPKGKHLHIQAFSINAKDTGGSYLHQYELYINSKKTMSGYFIPKYYYIRENTEIVLKGGDTLELRVYNTNTTTTDAAIHFEAWFRGYLGEK